MNKKRMFIGGGILGAVVLIAVLVISSGSAVASAQSVSTGTPLPPVTAGSQVIVDGRLIPQQGVELSAPAGGRVEDVLVAEGDTVAEGQVLVALSGRHQAEADAAAAGLELLSARKAQAELRRDKGILIAQAALDEAVTRKAAEEARVRVWDSTSTAEHERMTDAQQWLEAAYGRYATLQSADDGSAGSGMRIEHAYREYIRAAQDYQAAESDYENALVDGGSSTSTAAADISRAEYELARAKWESALAELNRLSGKGPETELAMADARVLSAEKRAAAAQSALEALELCAPFAGVVVDLSVKAGDYAAPGAEVVAVADLNAWDVETTDLSETDVTRIAVGDKAVLTFDAVPGLELPAEVVRISRLGKERQGEMTYRVTLALDGNDDRLLWNMTVMVKIQQ
jgi:multidrug efflux pump subunit AcrA (membrane-fusion protein)